jgi:hypothetical protein
LEKVQYDKEINEATVEEVDKNEVKADVVGRNPLYIPLNLLIR